MKLVNNLHLSFKVVPEGIKTKKNLILCRFLIPLQNYFQSEKNHKTLEEDTFLDEIIPNLTTKSSSHLIKRSCLRPLFPKLENFV